MANGPPSVKFAPLAQTSSYAAYCGGAALFDSPQGGTSPCRGRVWHLGNCALALRPYTPNY